MTQELVKELFEYRDGNLYWKISKQRIKVGQIAGCFDYTRGYRRIKINGKSFSAHRLIWVYHYGNMRKEQIDHINGIKNDNRIDNLREATRSQNCANVCKSIGLTSKFKGVCWHIRDKKWSANIRISGIKKHLGNFNEESAAAQAYNEAAIKHFGEFALINKI